MIFKNYNEIQRSRQANLAINLLAGFTCRDCGWNWSSCYPEARPTKCEYKNLCIEFWREDDK